MKILLMLLFPILTFAADIKPAKKKVVRRPAQVQNAQIFIGHNLTPSTEVLTKGAVTAGNYAVGYGVTENILLATSPWIWTTYNTTNLHLKYSQIISPQSTAGFLVSYFDSFGSGDLIDSSYNNSMPGAFALPSASELPIGTNRYQWTNYSASGLYSYRYEGGNTQYLNLKYSYFVNDDRPYSLRMDPGDDGIRDQVDVSTLLKIPVEDGASISLEGGVIGVNFVEPYAHMGASVGFQNKGWLVQVGASYTVPVSLLGTADGMDVGRMDQRIHYSEIAKRYYTERYLQIAVHPEVQIQYSF
jgi:hypothetical protein